MTWKHRAGRWLLPKLPASELAIEILRAEFRSLWVTTKNATLPWRRRRLAAALRTNGSRLNVACGPYVLDGFVNLDLHASGPGVVELDCRRLPFANGSVEGIRVEHFVEHLEPRRELSVFLGHCLRILVHGGALRIVVPDAERYLRAYCRDDLQGFVDLAVPIPFPADLPTRMDIVNHTFHQWHEHRWGYDYETLALRLRHCGFRDVQKMEFRKSIDPALAADRDEHAPYSLYVDAIKP